MSSRIAVSVQLGLAFSICAPESAARQDSSFSDPAAIRAIYDSAFAYVEAALPPQAHEQTSPYWPVWALARFRQQAVGWLELRGEGYYALSSGQRPAAWLVVVPDGSPALARMRSGLQLDPTTELLVGQIAPQPITVPWAGILVWRQLSLLADYAVGVIAAGADDEAHYATEFRGYQAELIVADLLSQGAMRLQLDSTLSRAGVSGLDDLAVLIGRTANFAGTVTATVPADPSASVGEHRLRGGFVIGALVVRYCELRGLDAVTALDVMKRLFPGSSNN